MKGLEEGREQHSFVNPMSEIDLTVPDHRTVDWITPPVNGRTCSRMSKFVLAVTTIASVFTILAMSFMFLLVYNEILQEAGPSYNTSETVYGIESNESIVSRRLKRQVFPLQESNYDPEDLEAKLSKKDPRLRKYDQSHLFAPTAPEEVDKEVVKTGQKTTVVVPKQVQQLCYLIPTSVGTSYSCYPRKRAKRNTAPNEPIMHVPTAVSSPNPHYFPTVNGASVLKPGQSAAATYYYLNGNVVTPVFEPSLGGVVFYNTATGNPESLQPDQPKLPYPEIRHPTYYTQVPGHVPVVQPISSHANYPLYGIPWTWYYHQPPAQAYESNPFRLYCTYVPVPDTPQVVYNFPTAPGVIGSFKSPTDSKKSDTSGFETTQNSSTTPRDKNLDECEGPNIQWCRDQENCVSVESICDGKIDCADLSDEEGCSCKSRIGHDKLCDGFFDCPDGEDELGCFGCSKNHFSCKDWSRKREHASCVPLGSRCDGIEQCPNGEDEKDCYLLFDTVGGHGNQIVSYGEGYLHRNFRGVWYPVCMKGRNAAELAQQACRAEFGETARIRKLSLNHYLGKSKYSGPFIGIFDGEVTFMNSCRENKVNYAECIADCGTRMAGGNEEDLMDRWRRFISVDVDLGRPGHDPYHRGYYRPQPYYSGLWQEHYPGHYSGYPGPNVHYSDYPGPYGHYSDYPGSYHGAAPLFRRKRASEMSDGRDKREDDSDARVVGGKKSSPGKWPWIVVIYRDGVLHCGGTIISRTWVLTAAHCFDNYHRHYYEVRAGVLRRFSFSPQEQIRKVVYIVIHGLFNRAVMSNDLALIELERPLKFNRWVRHACLPSPSAPHLPEPGTLCTAVGWGAVEENGLDPDHLHEVELPILDKCKHLPDLLNNQICAGLEEGGRDTCQGDSGGPLLCHDNGWYLAGVVSHGNGCARPNEPGAYTRVLNFTSWIEQTIRGSRHSAEKPLDSCPGFTCVDKRCISSKRQCDGNVDCLTAEDELYCIPYFKSQSTNDTARSMDVPSTLNFIPSDKKKIQKEITSTLATTEPPPESTTMVLNVSSNNFATTFSQEGNKLDEFTCKRWNQLIAKNRHCDGIRDCEDGSDEIGCSCMERVKRKAPQLLCDGVIDCKDGTDEEGCPRHCNMTSFHCFKSNSCIPLSLQCNREFDCPGGEDEIDCYGLVKLDELSTRSSPSELNQKGIVVVKVHDEWTPYCVKNVDEISQKGFHVCSSLGFRESVKQEEFLNNGSEINHNGMNNCTYLKVECAGLKSQDNSRPFLAKIYHAGTPVSIGFLFSPSWVAAPLHAILEQEGNILIVSVGESLVTKLGSVAKSHEVRQVKLVKYVPMIDLALLRLSTPAKLNHGVRAIELQGFLPSENNKLDKCEAIGLNDSSEIEVSELKLENDCSPGVPCIDTSRNNNCSASATEGGIVCFSSGAAFYMGSYNKKNWRCGESKPLQALPNMYKFIDKIKNVMNDSSNNDSSKTSESVCKTVTCEFGQCLDLNDIGDGVPHCLDGRDETDTTVQGLMQLFQANNKTCPINSLKCGDGSCISISRFCDGKADCSDKADEPEKCDCGSFLALSDPERLCDGVPNCADKSDELHPSCQANECEDITHYQCQNSTKCIPRVMLCDDSPDCPNNDDEQECIHMVPNPEKLSEFTLEIRLFGEWGPFCHDGENLDFLTSLCKEAGLGSATSSYIIPITQQPLVIDPQYSIVKLNDQNNIILRPNRPIIFRNQTTTECKQLFISCK